LERLLKKCRHCNGNKYDPSFRQNAGQVTEDIKKNYRSKRRKEAGETTEETSGRVRPEWVDKWPNPMIFRLLLLLVVVVVVAVVVLVVVVVGVAISSSGGSSSSSSMKTNTQLWRSVL